MIRALKSAAACLLFSTLLLQGQTAATAEKFTIAGTVVDRASNQPINRAVVRINNRRDQQLSCITAGDGRFVFTGLPAGKYNLFASAHGHVAQAFRAHEIYSTGIVAGPGLDTEHIVFPIEASGSISGAVLDEEGDPVPHPQVWLFHQGVFSGKWQIRMEGSQQGDSSGLFHFGHLGAGTYFVGVQARPWYAQNEGMRFGTPRGGMVTSPAAPELDVAYPITYYGDAVDPSAATPIAVTEGSSANLQITLHPVPTVHVQLTGIDWTQSSFVNATAYAIGPGGVTIGAGGSSANAVTQSISGLAPGNYVLSLELFNGGRPKPLGAKMVNLNGDSTLDISAVAKTSLSGELRWEGAHPQGQIWILFVKPGAGPNGRAMIGDDGTFTVRNTPLLVGRYEIQLQNAAGFYLKSVAVKGAEFSGAELDIPASGSVHLSLVAAPGLSDVNGIAKKDDKPFAGAMVLLIPQDRSRPDFIRLDQSDSDGTFSLKNVAPGRYTILAIDDGRDLAYEDPAAIKPYLSEGEAITVPVGNGPVWKVNVLTRQR